MSKIMCYGEDGLTLAAVTQHLGKLLAEIRSQHRDLDEDEDISLEDCLVFYRPSFGRNGGKKGASFGEFDAIIATKKNVYLIESKRYRSPSRNTTIMVKKNQVRRHQIFEWIWDNWESGQSWEQFRTDYSDAFRDEFNDKPLANSNRQLAKNLKQVLDLIYKDGRSIQHILLAFYHNEQHIPSEGLHKSAKMFRLVPFHFKKNQIEQVFEVNLDTQQTD
ncbi:hypothetical protein Enr10x_22970 [Gimesia panareensis]|uniref:Uncharacterized protein n=1 Tax=Gimesia panareensis TaxID=2527978 RepID=A0A517Q5W0_9PLAN|nr:hypothetical protein [Gimesia panareensis]QDT26984.1 hypothetical protein Enr10x_22970 [Gimesia panareensis]